MGEPPDRKTMTLRVCLNWNKDVNPTHKLGLSQSLKGSQGPPQDSLVRYDDYYAYGYGVTSFVYRRQQ
jgi:hypothetical protein